MADPPVSTASEGGLKAHSCTVCQRRKVKCDRKDPCSNCVRSKAECEFRDPLPPRRRRKQKQHQQQSDPVVLNRLRRYEDVFKKVGIDPDALDRNPRREGEVSTMTRTAATSPFVPETSNNRLESGKLVAKEGRSIYLHNDLWQSVSNELQDDADDILPEGSGGGSQQPQPLQAEGPDLDEGSLVFGSTAQHDLARLHPKPVHVFKLWQAFLDNVNPLTKVVHAPTLQQQILNATSDLGSISKELEALMFAIYHAALRSLNDDEAVTLFGEAKTGLLTRYRQGAQRALVNAEFLKTSDLAVLQALLIFILSIRLVCDPHTLWSLSGIALRIAQRIGLHRDGFHLGLSVFETEMRRRLWWQLTVVDATIAQMSGSISPLFSNFDTRPPLNINDSDLDPNMKERPVEAAGPTEMIFCLARYELGQWLYRHANSNPGASDGLWEAVTGPSIPLREKDRRIRELEDALEEKFIRYCDTSIPLHLITVVVAKSIVAMMRLSACHPRRYQESGDNLTQTEKDRLFRTCVGVAEHSNTLLTSNKTQRYLWHVDYHFPWNSIITLLSELRHRTTGGETANAWRLVDVTCTHPYEQLGSRAKSPLHLAVAKLAIKAWIAHVSDCNAHGVASLPQPTIVTTFWNLIQRAKSTGPDTSFRYAHKTPSPLSRVTEGLSREDQASGAFTAAPTVDMGGYGNFQVGDAFSPSTAQINLNRDDLGVWAQINPPGDSPTDWAQWDELLQQFQQQDSDRSMFGYL